MLSKVEVFSVFWGSAWMQPPQSDLIPELNQFFEDILVGPLLDQLSEYGVAGSPIQYGRRTGTVTVNSPELTDTASDDSVRQMLQEQIQHSPDFAAPAPNTLYFIYLPPGVPLTSRGGQSCQTFCGYHDAIDDKIFYAAMPYPGCSGCLGGLSDFDALTLTSSHELCEAITDPIPGLGWYDDNNGEIGDICPWKTKQLGRYTVQLEWSNNASDCI